VKALMIPNRNGKIIPTQIKPTMNAPLRPTGIPARNVCMVLRRT
jgi:hypothetical protein